MFSLSSDFLAELANIDAVLGKDADLRRAQLEAELAALKPRFALAQARGLNDLALRLGEMLQHREREQAALEEFLKLSSPASATPAIPVTPPAPKVPEPPKEPVARAIRARSRPAPIVEPLPFVPEEELATIVEPEPIPEPVKTPPREIIRKNQAFAKREREFFAKPGRSRERFAELKGLVLEARSLIEASEQADLDTSTLWQSVELLSEEFEKFSPGGSFFGFAPRRHHKPELWAELSEAFYNLGPTEKCLEWLDDNQEVTEKQELLKLAGAAEAWVHRLNDEHALGFTDEQQRDLHRHVEILAGGEIYIPWWNSGDGRRPTEEVVDAARQLNARFLEISRRIEASARKDDAMGALEGLIASLDQEGAVEDTLLPAVIRCLEAGIPPSNKKLVAVCLPYRAALKEVDDRRVAKLVEYLSKEEALLSRKIGAPVDGDLTEEPEDATREAVKSYVAGKTILFIGGRRIPEKKKEVENALGLRELMWPDADPDTLLHDFKAAAIKADIVCYLIRWSRHSYKQVIDFAKANGKETVVLKAGVGVNRLVHDLYEQLVTHKEEAAV